MQGDLPHAKSGKDACKRGKEMEKKIIILCDLGVGGERGRVVWRGGYRNGDHSNGL